MEKDRPHVLEPKKKVGLIVVLTGNGKGKTTSAMGMALRAVGHGLKVCVIEFMKGDMYAGEIDGFKRLAPEVEFNRMGKGFYGIKSGPHAFGVHRANAQEALSLAKEKLLSGSFHLIILDEINNALRLGLLDLEQVLDLLDSKPPLVHLVLTGRDAHPDVIGRAHTVTEMREVKHAFHDKLEPQKGVDY